MAEKYLLYIDILAFRDLVQSDPSRVGMLYQIIDSLNVHRHSAFRTVVFSDTIIVYNDAVPSDRNDRKYLVMYACEFAQDLQHRLTGQNIFFRAILVLGEFNHYSLRNIECFYGCALIDAYLREKKIPAIGLFIDDKCNTSNDIFPTERFNKSLSFVYLNQSLERLQMYTGGKLPTEPFLLEQTDDYWDILWDIKQLRDIHHHMNLHPDPNVRTKYLMTWHLFRQRYPRILDELETGQFSPNVICNEFDWSEKVKFFENEVKYFSKIEADA